VNLHVSTYNIHKGFSQFNRRMMIHELRDHLQVLGADIIFLQEVQGLHSRHAARFEDWPDEPQYEFLADQVWPEFAYGRNAVYDHGHHGNAILSRYPIVRAENQDVSHHALERRGMLHCEIELPEMPQRLHCICVHLALHERGRRHQVGAIIERLNREVPDDAPSSSRATSMIGAIAPASASRRTWAWRRPVAIIAASRCAPSRAPSRCCVWTASTCADSACAIRTCTTGRCGGACPTTPPFPRICSSRKSPEWRSSSCPETG